MRLKYAWRIESLFPDIDANTVGNRLSVLEGEHGSLSKSLLVQEGKNTKSPLYPLFERNAQTALEKWNYQRARQILNSLVIVRNGRKMRKAAFVYVDAPQSAQKSYVSLVVAMRSPSLREQVVERGAREFMRWVERYAGMPEFKPARQSIRRVKKQVEESLLTNV